MIEVSNLSKSFKTLQVLKNINLTVPKNSVFGFIGINGAGKSTFIKCLMNFLTPDAGTIVVKNKKVISSVSFRKEIGYLPEVFQPPLDLKCNEFISYCYGLIKNKRCPQKDIKDVLEKVGLSQSYNTIIRKLSKGMRQRLGLAQAIIHSPNILILDEPFSGLDPIGRFRLKNLLIKLKTSTDSSIFFSSHNLTEIQDLCTHIAILHDGEIKAYGSVEEILKNSSSMSLEDFFLKTVDYKE